MSSRRRNLIPQEKVQLSQGMQLPEINRRPLYSPGSTFGEDVHAMELERKSSFGGKYYNTLSSAASVRMQNMFYRSDWPSLSDTGTDSPDYVEAESSGSSASSMFSWADAEGSRLVSEEWEKIQRTLYGEEGPKVTQQHLMEECEQWRTIFPHLRVVGHRVGVFGQENDESYDTEEEVLAAHYDSSNDDKESKIPKKLVKGGENQKLIPFRNNAKSSHVETSAKYSHNSKGVRKKSGTGSLIEDLDAFLHITPLSHTTFNNVQTYRNNLSSSIIKSEISSSRWRNRNNSSPDFVSLPHNIGVQPLATHCAEEKTRNNSAVSVFSLNSKINGFGDAEINRFKISSKNNVSANLSNFSAMKKHRNSNDKIFSLEPIDPALTSRAVPSRSISIPQGDEDILIRNSAQRSRNVSLPPIQAEDTKEKRRPMPSRLPVSSHRGLRNHKTTLVPLDSITNCLGPSSVVSKANVSPHHVKTHRQRKWNGKNKV